MKLISANNLSKKQLSDIAMLETLWNHSYNLIYEPNTDYEDNYFAFHYEDNILVSCISYMILDDYIEISAITHPSYTNKGYATNLIKKANLQKYNLPLLYTLSPTMNKDRHNFLKTEYMLKYHISNLSIPDIDPIYELKGSLIPMGIHYTLYLNHEEIGYLDAFIQENFISIYNVFIKEDKRGNGYSHILLNLFFKKTKNADNVFLHVSSDNIIACKLYFSIGFTIQESIDYYVL